MLNSRLKRLAFHHFICKILFHHQKYKNSRDKEGHKHEKLAHFTADSLAFVFLKANFSKEHFIKSGTLAQEHCQQTRTNKVFCLMNWRNECAIFFRLCGSKHFFHVGDYSTLIYVVPPGKFTLFSESKRATSLIQNVCILSGVYYLTFFRIFCPAKNLRWLIHNDIMTPLKQKLHWKQKCQPRNYYFELLTNFVCSFWRP